MSVHLNEVVNSVVTSNTVGEGQGALLVSVKAVVPRFTEIIEGENSKELRKAAFEALGELVKQAFKRELESLYATKTFKVDSVMAEEAILELDDTNKG